MQKKNCVLCISIGIIVCILLSACSRQPDFDAKSYVQSSLDAHYHGEYKDYANLLEISEKDAKKEIEEDFNECLLIKQLSVTSNSYICSGHTRIGTDAKEHKVFASES